MIFIYSILIIIHALSVSPCKALILFICSHKKVSRIIIIKFNTFVGIHVSTYNKYIDRFSNFFHLFHSFKIPCLPSICHICCFWRYKPITTLFILMQNPEPSVEFNTVPNEKQQHEVNVGKIFSVFFYILFSWE